MKTHKTTTDKRCLYCVNWVQDSIPVGWGTCLRYPDHEVDTSQDTTCDGFEPVRMTGLPLIDRGTAQGDDQ